jgi:hypothetical protein
MGVRRPDGSGGGETGRAIGGGAAGFTQLRGSNDCVPPSSAIE